MVAINSFFNVIFSMLQGMLEQIASWIHRYIGNQDGLETFNANIRAHAIFYSICQCLFYVIAFRHRDLIKSKKSEYSIEIHMGTIKPHGGISFKKFVSLRHCHF